MTFAMKGSTVVLVTFSLCMLYLFALGGWLWDQQFKRTEHFQPSYHIWGEAFCPCLIGRDCLLANPCHVWPFSYLTCCCVTASVYNLIISISCVLSTSWNFLWYLLFSDAVLVASVSISNEWGSMWKWP